MKHTISLILIVIFVWSCQNKKSDDQTETIPIDTSNITKEVMSDLEWQNEPKTSQIVDNSLFVTVNGGTDFFNSPEDNSIVTTAPFLYQEIEGDFVAKIQVQPDFSKQWNAISLLMYMDSLNWIKLAFENSDATGPSIVTVVTKGTSDDSNGAVLNDVDKVYLAMVRKDNIYSMHWSKDGINYNMARLTKMPVGSKVKVGIEAQCPIGEEAKHKVSFLSIERRTVENLRKLV